MSSWRDNINLNSCIWFENEEFKRNSMSAAVSGLMFFVGWWLLIDANVIYPDIDTWYYIWGILGTISLIMVNSVSQSQTNNYSESAFGVSGTSIWLFVGFLLGFASVIASFLILFTDFYSESKPKNKIPGFELLFQNVLIFLSSLIYKFGRVEDQF